MKIARVNGGSIPFLSSPLGPGGTVAQPSMEDLTDVDVTGIADGDVLIWDAGTSTWIVSSSGGGGGGSGSTDHEHVNNVVFSGDGSTTVFELPAAPFDPYSIAVYVTASRSQDWTLSGAMLTTLTFGSAPASSANNIVIDIVAAVA